MAKDSTRRKFSNQHKFSEIEEEIPRTSQNKPERRNSAYSPRLSVDRELVKTLSHLTDHKPSQSFTSHAHSGNAQTNASEKHLMVTTRSYGHKELTTSVSPGELSKSRLPRNPHATTNKQIRFITDDRSLLTLKTNRHTDEEHGASDLDTLLSSGYICKEDVCSSLDKKANVSRDKINISTPDNSEESSLVRSGSLSYDSDNDSASIKGNTIFTGRMTKIGDSRLVSRPVPNAVLPKTSETGRCDSLFCEPGITQSFMMEDVWPWPWLDPDRTSSEKYVGADHKTFCRQSELRQAEPPLLALTLKGYLDSLEPCVTADQFAKVRKMVEEFALCKGNKITEAFLNKIEGSSPWHRKALTNYDFRLSRHEQVLQNVAVVIPFCDDLWPPKPNTQIDRSVELITMTLEFFRLVAKEKLKPLNNWNNQPLCMHSFRKLFSSSRIPGLLKDSVESYFHTNNTGLSRPRHIVVIYKGTFFYLAVLDGDSKIIQPNTLKEELIRIKDKLYKASTHEGCAIGVLTSTDRDVWHAYREKLVALNTSNAANLRIIDEALFILSLDDVSVCRSALSHEAVFADGCNRWYDKSLSFYVYENGLATCSADTACQDGWAIAVLLDFIHLRILEDTQKWDDDLVKTIASKISLPNSPLKAGDRIFQQLRKKSSQHDVTYKYTVNSKTNVGQAQEFAFTLNAELKEEIGQAIFRFVKLQEEFLTAECEYTCFRNDMFSNNKLHPSAFAHLLIHLSFFRMYYRIALMGSKIQTKTFYHGRYEYLRSTTKEASAWCKAMIDPAFSKEEKNKLFWSAVNKHMQLYHRCLAGQGCDNHLTALKLICIEMGGKTPDMFSDKMLVANDRFEVYVESLGVSFLARKVVLPRQRKGYGVGYTLVNSRLVCVASSWAEETTTSAELLAATIKKTLEVHHDFFDDL